MGRAFANWYDFFMNPLEKRKIGSLRKKLLSKATGKVLEIGSGTGVNFPLYVNAESVVAIEPSLDMIKNSSSKINMVNVPITVINASAEQLPFANNSFDSVVATLVFCTIEDGQKAVNEIKRVGKPNGKILLIEHVKMDHRFLSGLQDLLTPFWKKICDGCCLNRETLKLLTDNRLKISKVEKYYNGLFIVIEAENCENE
ncbi:class I SAM-dependent methyltransferase [Pseudoneobacillus sp. C159]